ncbi:9055_t:CDS:1 [Funneliformis geosporum]|uniref:10276_t:CDS:1 n=1 Tax=Funneliformis geosporum TaxID=1117311 RepID=A0A9W4WKS6_9GLOM|nr:10276_t:CDS:1 [Funneliformis geosporum]CAI2161503.1 9055_t:CDS:1 [Funneliformis geosporum]
MSKIINLDFFTEGKINDLRKNKYKSEIDYAISLLKKEVDTIDVETFVRTNIEKLGKNRNGKIKRPSNSNILYTNTLNNHLGEVVKKICDDFNVNMSKKMPLMKKFSNPIWKELKEKDQKYTEFFENLALKIKTAHTEKHPDYVYTPNRNKHKQGALFKQFHYEKTKSKRKVKKVTKDIPKISGNTSIQNDRVNNSQQMENSRPLIPQEPINNLSNVVYIQDQSFRMSPIDHFDNSQQMSSAQVAQVMSQESIISFSNVNLQPQRFKASPIVGSSQQMGSVQVQESINSLSNLSNAQAQDNFISRNDGNAYMNLQDYGLMNTSDNSCLDEQFQNVEEPNQFPQFHEKRIFVDLLCQQNPFEYHVRQDNINSIGSDYIQNSLY